MIGHTPCELLYEIASETIYGMYVNLELYMGNFLFLSKHDDTGWEQ